jgi:hypothetical protein
MIFHSIGQDSITSITNTTIKKRPFEVQSVIYQETINQLL